MGTGVSALLGAALRAIEVGPHVCPTPPRRDGGRGLSVGGKDSRTVQLDLDGSIQAERLEKALQGGGHEHGTGGTSIQSSCFPG